MKTASSSKKQGSFLTGVIVRYDIPSRPFPLEGTLTLKVEETDLPGVVPGAEIEIAMVEPSDSDFLLKDLEIGYMSGNLEPAPAGSKVRFLGCALADQGKVHVSAYDVASIERPAGSAPSV